MKKIYLYIHHTGFDFYLSDYEIPFGERYCPDCECANELLGIYDNEMELAEKLKELLSKGFDPIVCDTYQNLARKYNLSKT